MAPNSSARQPGRSGSALASAWAVSSMPFSGDSRAAITMRFWRSDAGRQVVRSSALGTARAGIEVPHAATKAARQASDTSTTEANRRSRRPRCQRSSGLLGGFGQPWVWKTTGTGATANASAAAVGRC